MNISYHPRSLAFLKKLDYKPALTVVGKIEKLRQFPRIENLDVKKLINTHSYRLRIGKIRVIFEIIKSTIYILDIDFRGNIY